MSGLGRGILGESRSEMRMIADFVIHVSAKYSFILELSLHGRFAFVPPPALWL